MIKFKIWLKSTLTTIGILLPFIGNGILARRFRKLIKLNEYLLAKSKANARVEDAAKEMLKSSKQKVLTDAQAEEYKKQLGL